jgi:hypothetical protein
VRSFVFELSAVVGALNSLSIGTERCLKIRCVQKIHSTSQFLFSVSLYGDSDTEVEQRREENVDDTGKTAVSDHRKDQTGSNGVVETSSSDKTTKTNILDESLNLKNAQVTTGDAIKDRETSDLRRCCLACSHTECWTITKNSVRDGPN